MITITNPAGLTAPILNGITNINSPSSLQVTIQETGHFYVKTVDGTDFFYVDNNLTFLETSFGAYIIQNTGIVIETLNENQNLQFRNYNGVNLPTYTKAELLAKSTTYLIEGAMFYCSDIKVPVFWDGTGWKKISHSAL